MAFKGDPLLLLNARDNFERNWPAMVELFDKFVRLPLSGKVERSEREKLMRKVADGIKGASNPF